MINLGKIVETNKWPKIYPYTCDRVWNLVFLYVKILVDGAIPIWIIYDSINEAIVDDARRSVAFKG